MFNCKFVKVADFDNEVTVLQIANRPIATYSSSHGILFLSVAVSTTERQVSRVVAFFQADERLIFSGFKFASIARSQVWLGLPFGSFLAILAER